jgi:hypothetical protein
MKGIRSSAVLTPTAAVVSALATLTCCLPWGIGAALGALSLSVFIAKFQVWFLALSLLLLAVGVFQVLRKGASCRKRSRVEITLLSIAAAVVLAVVLFPQWVAGLLVGRLP